MTATTIHPHRPATAPRRGLTTALVALLAVALGLVALPARDALAAGGQPAVSPVLDAGHGFPTWFEDSGGTRLAPCLDPTDTRCVVLADAGYDPARPQVFPTNFPEEFFYLVADSQRLTTGGCSGTKRGTATLRLALEGAFANGAPVPGEQMVFGRVRLSVSSGLCANGTYTATTPFGAISFRADASGALARNQGTTDVGCVPVAPATCDWRLALSSPVARSFLRWDPAVAPAAPAGYLGDAVTAHRIVGATYTAPGEASPANYFSIAGTKLATPLRTDLFTVAGKVAGPLEVSPAAVTIGSTEVGQSSSVRDITVRNVAAGTTTPSSVTVTGAAADDFQIVDSSCPATPLGRDATCVIRVRFAPTALGARTATLTVAHDGLRSPTTVPLAGEGTAPHQAPHATADPSSLGFGQERLRVPSSARTVTVGNTGTAPLTLGTLELAGSDRTHFEKGFDTCTAAVVPVGGTCRVDVSYLPQAVGEHSATLRIPSDDPAGTLDVALEGTGFGGVAKTSPVIDTATGFPTWYQDERGVRVAQCIDATDPNCIVLAGGTYPGSGPVAFPTTFPDEFFYSVVDSDIITTPGCGDSPPGKMMVRMALEAAFVNGEPVSGEQMTFGRIRVNATSGLCAGQEYSVVHPYGTYTFVADDAGGLKRTTGTSDVGCLAATADAPCAWDQAISSPVLAGFLRWDPARGAAAPAGYLGDATTLHRVVGSSYVPVGESAPANYVRLVRAGATVAQTDLFTVMGKLAGPLVADPEVVDAGAVEEGSSGPARVTLRNEGIETLGVTSLSVAGNDAADFAVGSDACSGRDLAPGAACQVDLTFTPGAVGDRSALLRVRHTGLNDPFEVRLRGVGSVAQGIAALSTSGALAFEQRHVGRAAVVQSVTVSNRGGTAPLVLDAPTLVGGDAADFSVVGTTCDTEVPVDGTCTVTVGFTPSAAGTRTTALRLTAPGARPSQVDVGLSGRGSTSDPAVSAGRRADGFPLWYQDADGLRLDLCDDPTDPGCIVLGGDGYDPTQPISFPDNYPPELFYAVADSEPMPTPGCDTVAPGTAALRVALEGAFTGPTAEAGQQLVFGRLRFHATGLCPDTDYTVTTPYGPLSVHTDASGSVARNAATQNVGCGAAPCDMGEALASPVVGSFLRWAPGVGRAAPAGHLGDAVTFHEVVGGTWAPDGVPVEHVAVTGPEGEVARTDLFAVAGRYATGLTGDASLAFGDHDLGTTTDLTATLQNVGTGALPLGTVRVTGPQAAAFTLGAGTCAGATLPGDGTCTQTVRWAPTTAGDATATLEVLGADGSVLSRTSLTGHGIEPPTPARAAVTPTTLTFAGQRVTTTSAVQLVGVRNSGGAPLTVTSVALSGTAAGDYTATADPECASVVAGASCSVRVTFSPRATGTRAATLSIRSNDPGAAPAVALTGTGTSSVLTPKSTSVSLGTVKIGRSASSSVTITNTGTASLSITGTTSTSTAYSVALGTCAVAVAPGRSCSVTVTLNAQAVAGSYPATIGFVSDAANRATVSFTATVR
ncbi:choice-of-anchor D domain-containing protein [Phycicoccus sp. MAQZ13P-2]|uniref:choice-of-anchor D domain-containing protein n=1 Tax=Phycicoccus mangrovi TaxID=2840470 RepID=UPI001C0015A9|nr:choice-of-anchor D domain-containing protein [Phycicoccus mangrovi]MBT9258060.1 choice-of-anchor D domain-containing protein [Phycicoccus mangrovi]MBT9276271.1 choice-of-anchor D domain-containing protein [Phycicoccus mangrovi]